MADDKPAQPGDKYIVRFPDGMRDQIASAAAASHRTINAEIVARLERTFQQDQAEREAMQELNAKLGQIMDMLNAPPGALKAGARKKR